MTSKCLRQNNKTQNTKKNTLEYLGTVLHRNQGYGRTEPSGNQSRSVAKSNRNVFCSTFLFVGKMENRCVENAKGMRNAEKTVCFWGSGGGEASGGRFWNVWDVFFMCSGVLVFF